MKSFAFILSVVAVIGLAFWAYSENYKTQRALNEIESLQRHIGSLRETRSVLRAEWAYLNRPDRLRDLASLNFAALELVPLAPAQFGRIEQIAYPSPESMPVDLPHSGPITNPVSVRGTLPTSEEMLEP